MTSSLQRVQLACGRFVSYREYGNLQGLPVVFAHGNLNSALFEPCWDKTEDVTKEAGVRVIALDRPGYGGSTFPADGVRSYTGWAKDVGEVTSLLGIDKFCVAGYSSGGPHALACATREAGPSLLSRVLAVAIISSDGPYKQIGGDELIKKQYHVDPPMTKEKANQVATVVSYQLKDAYGQIPNTTKQKIAMDDIANATVQGLQGAAYDAVLETGDWDFGFDSVERPVRMWHGDADADVPVECSNFMFSRFKAHALHKQTVLPGENHTMIRRQWKAILEDLKETALSAAQ